jgi:hypothetical protein
MTTIDYTPVPLTAEQRNETDKLRFDRIVIETRQRNAAERNREAREAEALSRAAQGRECK